MPNVGYLDIDRLVLIPERYWPHHEFCFFLHDQMLQLLRQYESSDIHNIVVRAFEGALNEMDLPAAEDDIKIDFLDALKKHGMVKQYRHHIVSHLVLALTADLLNFLYEALACFEKRKFAVGFSLLRKPLKENLLFLAWLLGNEDDFVARFEKDTYTTLNGIDPERRQQLLADAIELLATKEAFAADLLEEMIFSKAHQKSFESVWQRATHLITSQGALLRTEDLNLNFIFHDVGSDGFFDLLYSNLPYVMLFSIQLSLECFSRIVPANELTTSHLILSSMGAYESLFEGKRKVGVTSTLRRTLGSFMKCVHCGAPFRLTKDNAVGMYLRETLRCGKCHLASPFPLYWLLAQGKVKITRTNSGRPILDELR